MIKEIWFGDYEDYPERICDGYDGLWYGIFDNGKYFCAFIKERHGIGLEQWVAVSQPGWYVVRCNGFSNTNGLAHLYIKEYLSLQGGGNSIPEVKVPLQALEKDQPT